MHVHGDSGGMSASVALATRIDAEPPSVSVVICTHSERRWTLLCDAVASIEHQSHPADEIIVVVDHNPALLRRARGAFASALVVANDESAGLAGARNTALRSASRDVVVFIDDDAVADRRLLQRLLEPYAEPHVLGTGGAAVPLWPAARPRWFPAEFDWVVGCSYTGMPLTTARVRNPIGACMSFRRSAFERAGTFSNGLGRSGADRMGCEETEFSIRLQRSVPDGVLLYVPGASVQHRVDPDRARWRYFVGRCYAEGRSKALVSSAVGKHDALSSEWAYVTRVLPSAVMRGVRQALSGELSGLLRAAAIGAGLAATATGYAASSLSPRRARSSDGGR